MLRSFIASTLLVGMFVAPALAQRQLLPPRFQPQPAPPGFFPGEGPIPGQRILKPGDPSHKPQPGEENVPDVRDFLSGLTTPKNKNFDPKMLQDLLSKLPKDKQDPKQLEEMLKNNPQFKDPAFLKQLKQMMDSPDFAKLLQNQLNNMGNDGPIPKFDNPAELKNKLDEVLNKANDPNIQNPLNNDPTKPPELPKPTTPLGDDPANNEWVKWFEKNLGDSDATKDLIKDLTEAMGKPDLKGLFDDMPELKGQEWKEFGDWGKANFGNIKPSDFPDLKMGGSSGSSGGGGGPNFGGGSGGSLGGSGGGGGFGISEGAGMVLMIVAGVLGALLLAFFFFRKWKHDKEQEALLAAGTQGIDLSSIRTREELVAAFDAVSLEQIGDDAMNWNHRVIADQFAEAQPTNSAPANELAGLYEKARYAPEDENLTPNEFADARRDLHVLAGVSA